jgi:3-hydroxy-9,10-secoandrosta-1,3,5(10)-triene-9,17-dione monooxygenase
MASPTLEELTEQAAALVRVLRERAPLTEAQGKVPQETIDDFTRAGFFRVFVPKRYGGLELDYARTQVELGNQLGRGCGSSAWVQSVIAAHGWVVARMPEAAQQAVWAGGPDALMTTSISASTGTIKRVTNGYVLNGTWQFSSGCDYAQWILFGGAAEGDQTMRWYLVHIKDVRIDHDSWHAAGLMGTGSKDVSVADTFVPDDWSMPFADCPGAVMNSCYIYRLPLRPLFHLNVSCPALGVARGAVEEYVAQLRARPGRAIPGRHARLAESAAEVDAALALMRSDAHEVTELGRLECDPTAEQLARWERNSAYATLLCVRAVDRLLTSLGAHGVGFANPIHRAGRDVHAIASHTSNDWDTHTQSYTSWALGLESEPH